MPGHTAPPTPAYHWTSALPLPQFHIQKFQNRFPLTQQTDKDKNIGLFAPPQRRAKSEPHRTWHDDREVYRPTALVFLKTFFGFYV